MFGGDESGSGSEEERSDTGRPGRRDFGGEEGDDGEMSVESGGGRAVVMLLVH